MWQEAQSEQTTASPIADFLLPANQAGGYPSTAAAAARAGRSVDIPARLLLLLGLGEARALHVSVSKAAALFTPWSLSF